MRKNIKLVLAAFAAISLVTSCKKFIKEELVSTLTYDYYNSDQGLEDLVRSAYAPLRFKYENEQSYALWNFGVDEFVLGDQFNFNYYNTYDSRLNSSDGFLNSLWTNNYDGINRSNLGIERIASYSNGSSKTLGSEAQRNQRIAELRFLRGYYYFQLVQQFGGVPLVTQSSQQVRTDFPRSSVPEVYNQVIADLSFASNNLSATSSEQGRATRGAANHFLAKAYLTRGSAVADQRGQKPTDIDSAAYYADLVINSGVYTLEPDYMNLWQVAYPKGYPNVTVTPGAPPYNFDGKSGIASGDISKLQAMNNSKEIIFAANFSNNLSLTTNGNQVHLYFASQYDNGIPGLARTPDNFNMRPYRRLGPSNYAIDIFDRKNDSRFYKSFRTAYYANTNGSPKVALGDTAALFIVNDKNTTLTDADISKLRYTVFARYFRRAATGALDSGFSNNKYLALIKHYDPIRITSNFNEQRGIRNGTLARLGETYLIAAEAYGRKGDYAKALQYVNVIRKRAAYHAGEFKNPAYWMVEGGTKGDVTDTYAQIEATPALFTTNAASENYPASITSTEQRFIHFMLNERTRELLGELYRWEDLVRTETLYDRTRMFNKDAVNLQPYHKLRPIPQLQIELTTLNGQPFTPDQKKAYQNPGY